MKQNAIVNAVGRYLTTTSLHGFKYLHAPYKSDRVLWAWWCMASACCSGVLCAVLWGRFTQVPTLMSLRATDFTGAMPSLGFCIDSHYVANAVVNNIGHNETLPLVQALSNVLRGRPATEYQLSFLEYLLKKHGMSLQEALHKYTPSCEDIVTRCRVDNQLLACGRIVRRTLTMFGACCIMRPSGSEKKEILHATIRQLDVLLNCATNGRCPGFDLITQYSGMGWVKSTTVAAGYQYDAPLVFESIKASDNQQLVETTCNSDESYSRSVCRENCVERHCGCSDPLDEEDVVQNKNLPQCSMARLACLRSFNFNRTTCRQCLPLCKDITTSMSLKQTKMDANHFVVDPFYTNVNVNESIVLNVRILRIGSHVYWRMPTESWLTLLSSLGGVFNMFLGVGLFSALELIYFLFVRMPIAVHRSLEIEVL